MLFSVIIPTYKDWSRLQTCLESLQRVTGFKYEILVVDNEEDHSPPESLEQFSNVVVLHEPQPGSYSARNRGADLATGKYLAFTDADCIPDKDWLINAEKVFSEKGCSLIGGRIDLFKESGGSEWVYIYEKNMAFSQSVNVPKGKAVTANMFVKKEIFNRLDGFDSSLKSGGDWDFSKRVMNAGYTICYADDVVVKHPARRSLKALLVKQKRFAAWGFIKAKKKFGYSGARILAGNLYYGLGRIGSASQKPKNVAEKITVFTISTFIYFYASIYQFLFLLKIISPDRIRE